MQDTVTLYTSQQCSMQHCTVAIKPASQQTDMSDTRIAQAQTNSEMANYHGCACQGRNLPITSYTPAIACTPHFKADAQQPWVTQGNGLLSIGFWFSPKAGLTLEDVAAVVEGFVSSNISKQMPQPTTTLYTTTTTTLSGFEE